MTAQLDSEQVRHLLLRALRHDAVDDAVTELLFEHVVGGRYERSEVAAFLQLRIQDPLHASVGEDWEAIADAYAARDGDLDPVALGETGSGRVHEFDGTSFDVGLLREFLATILAHPVGADRIAAIAGTGGPEAPPVVSARGLRSAAAGVLLAPSKEDWGAVADQLIAQAREIDAEGRLGFYDLQRQRYAQANPIREAGEFQIGDYGRDGSPGGGGEFKVTLIELGNGGRWGLYPHPEVFGEGKAALRDAIDAGLLDILGPVSRPEEFARRLIAIGIVDRSDAPLSGEAAVAGAR
jgi:hypothetical protein